ncbi:gcn5-related n-acetyltransferase [Grosmannia clavigera kw1407]|uniref:Gcn5-related n-acetyltransferase n=1 Tax=Grosmannia clavigera (strain kw1407 / UAMH 11150) TaxID=655863 RepID=F0XGW1_GROCL|nr:gcn5-related n-acetyltransferase [Grosmannia clavigera kw1407]EFX03268.1 gcn5-related n-acetyltransferase [Grosmannia clavigera kw1407]
MADTASLSGAAAAAVAADVAAAARSAAIKPDSPQSTADMALSSFGRLSSPPLSSSSSPAIQMFDSAVHGHLVLYLAALHGSCITHDGLSGSFSPPLHHEKLLAWWKVRLASSVVLLWLLPSDAAKPAASDLVGAVMLRSHPAETSHHVAAVELLLVNPRERQKGGERLLLAAVEQQAVAAGRTLLTAETDADSPAALTFAELGFVEAGRIPGFVVRPSGEKRDQLVLYKNLAPSP